MSLQQILTGIVLIATTVFTCATGNPCESGEYCKNGGTCLFEAANNTARCLCDTKFGGERCELSGISLYTCPPELNHCQNGQCVIDLKSKATLCLCAQGFYGTSCEAVGVPVGRMDEENAVNLRLYTIIGIIIACCAMVGIVGVATVHVRNRRQQRRKSSKKADLENGKGKEMKDMSKNSPAKHDIGDHDDSPLLNKANSEHKRRATTQPQPHPQLVSLTEQLLANSRSDKPYGSEGCLLSRDDENGALTDAKKNPEERKTRKTSTEKQPSIIP